MSLLNQEGINCKKFTGYKPCIPGVDCTEECQSHEPIGTRILIINLDAMGDVLMTTAQLPGLKREYPESQIFWITLPSTVPLLQNNPFIDRVFGWNEENRLVLTQQRFDVVLNADKSDRACAFVKRLEAGEVRGFTLSDRGQIIPANEEALYNFKMGLDDHLKFRVNERTGQDILAETWKLPYQRDEYSLLLSLEEEAFCLDRKKAWGLEEKVVVGLNTGCAPLYPNKKMKVEQHVELIDMLAADERLVFLLLGGKEDTRRNDNIALEFADLSSRVIATPTQEGLRRGMCYENLCDIIVTGDTYGMHLGIALKKHVLAWFGLSCWTEIDLYDRGKKFYQPDLTCSPCWKKECPYNLECISRIDLRAIADEVIAFADSQHQALVAA
ncbi:MAG: heptosyltransferase [Ectothiorhodospiraceae bacterium]|nr:heptosyltransferase [Ectothiorhodospiraceae bacterium]